MTPAQEHYNWIMNIIDSCTHDFHFDAVDILIDLYRQRHQDDELFVSLKQMRETHWNSIHSILK
jgi:hypothetical protein